MLPPRDVEDDGTSANSGMNMQVPKFHVAHYGHQNLFIKVNHINDTEFLLCYISDAQVLSLHGLLVSVGLTTGKEHLLSQQPPRQTILKRVRLLFQMSVAFWMMMRLQFCLIEDIGFMLCATLKKPELSLMLNLCWHKAYCDKTADQLLKENCSSPVSLHYGRPYLCLRFQFTAGGNGFSYLSAAFAKKYYLSLFETQMVILWSTRFSPTI